MPIAADHLSNLQTLKLIQAVIKKNKDEIVKLIENGVPNLVNYSESSQGQTGLHLAACANDEVTIKELLSFGADCNIGDLSGRTPFFRAAEYGHLQSLKTLLESNTKPDLSATDTEGRNILHYCLHPTKRHQDCLQLALQFGASVHNIGNDKVSLLYKACAEGLENAVRCFIDAGIKLNHQNEDSGLSAMHVACDKGFHKCVYLLLQNGANPNIKSYSGNYPVHSASLNGHLDVLQMLSAYGADFNVADRHGDTPLHFAASKGLAFICKFIAQRGCPATKKNSDGCTPRVVAKNNEFKDALKECKKAEKIKFNKPNTQLHNVQFYDWVTVNKEKIVAYLKEPESGKTGKVRKDDLYTVLLSLKCTLDQDKINNILQVHNKDGKIDIDTFFTGKKYINKKFLVGPIQKKKKGSGKKGKKKKTKIEMPICIKEDSVRTRSGGPLKNYIEEKKLETDLTRFDNNNRPKHPIQDDSVWYCSKPDAVFIHVSEAIKYNYTESLKAAVNEGLDVNQEDKYYKTPLMLACLNGNFDAIKYLIAHGSNVNAKDNFKWTPLHFACHIGQKEIVSYLLDQGAILDAQSCNGGTPLMRAIESSKESVVDFLLSKGAKIQIENKKGETALDIAKAYGNQNIIKTIQTLWDNLPAPSDKRKRKGSPKKRSTKTASGNKLKSTISRNESHERSDTQLADMIEERSLKRNQLLSILTKEDNIAYTPKRAWVNEPTTGEQMLEREKRRERFGYEIDFEYYKPPFQQNISQMVVSIKEDE